MDPLEEEFEQCSTRRESIVVAETNCEAPVWSESSFYVFCRWWCDIEKFVIVAVLVPSDWKP